MVDIKTINHNIREIWYRSPIEIKEEDVLVCGQLREPRKILTRAYRGKNNFNLRDERFKNALENYKINIAQVLLVPYNISGKNLCPQAGVCKNICLAYQGKGSKSQLHGQLRRTLIFLYQREKFIQNLVKEIISFINFCKKENFHPVIRLNGYSDILWEKEKFKFKSIQDIFKGKKHKIGSFRYSNHNRAGEYLSEKISTSLNSNKNREFQPEDEVSIFDIFYDILFYDYTKYPDRKVPPNYHLTFSYDKQKDEIVNNMNIAVIVDSELKKEILSDPKYRRKVVDGDHQDCRIIDDMNLDKEQKIILLEYQDKKFHNVQSKNQVAYTLEEKEEFIDKFLK